jgi:N6-adenosine-specific RNA methylase IME4
VLADPAWAYSDNGKGKRGATGRHYETMPLEDIICLAEPMDNRPDGDGKDKRLFIAGHEIAAAAWLWLWTTNAFLADGSAASVCNAWGFRPITILTWCKQTMTQARRGRPLVTTDGEPLVDLDVDLKVQTGHYLRNVTEHIVLAVRGEALSLRLRADVPTSFYAPVSRPHSRKPDESYRIIESVCPGPRLELFARRRFSEEWTVWGNQAPPQGDQGGDS